MTLQVIEGFRRELRALKTLAYAGRLDPDSFKKITDLLGARVDDLEAFLEENGTLYRASEVERIGALPLVEMRFIKGMGVIDGGRA